MPTFTGVRSPELQSAPGLRLRLLPLAVASIWACTALSVEIARPSVGEALWRTGLPDLLVNVCLYLPLGVALRRRGFLFALGLTATLSFGIETVQLFYPDRYTAATDVVANVLGAVLGRAVARRFGRRSAWGLDPVTVGAGWGVVLGLVYAVSLVWLADPGPASDFSNWDPACRVVAGDELTRNRPWRGSIDAVAVFDRCLGGAEVRVLSGLDRGEPLDVRVSSLGPVFATRFPVPFDSIRGIPLLGPSDQDRFFDRLTSSGELTVMTWFTTASETQKGPARIFGFSKSPWALNFSLGQEQGDIVFRLRTPTTNPGGFFPQTRTRCVLVAGRSACVVATYDSRSVRVYVDGRLEARVNLRADGRRSPFLADSGLPVAAALLGGLMSVVWVVAAWRRKASLPIWGTFGGLVGGVVFLLAGGADALPEFGSWVPLVAAWAGFVVGGSAIRDAPTETGT